MKMHRLLHHAIVVICTSLLYCCNPVTSGGGGPGTGSEVIAFGGKVCYENQLPAAGTTVILRSVDSTPPLAFAISNFQQITNTDKSGNFNFEVNYKGKVLIEAVDSTGLSTTIGFTIGKKDDLPELNAILHSSVLLTGRISAVTGKSSQYDIFIPGLRRFKTFSGGQFSLTIPAGNFDFILCEEAVGCVPGFLHIGELRPGEIRNLGFVDPPLPSDTPAYTTFCGYINPAPILEDQYIIRSAFGSVFTNDSGFYSIRVPSSEYLRLEFYDVLENAVRLIFDDTISPENSVVDTFFLENSQLTFYGIVKGNVSPVPEDVQIIIEVPMVCRKAIVNCGNFFMRIPPGDHELKFIMRNEIKTVRLDSILHGEIRDIGTINW